MCTTRPRLALLALLALGARSAHAQDVEEIYRGTLVGLSGVVVSLSHISDDLVQAGLDSATLITDTELRLRQGGIRVLNTTEALATPGAGVLVVIVTAGRRSNTRGWLLHIGTELHQRVRLERDPTVLTLAPTWRSQGVTATDDDVARIRQIVRDHVDQFVNAWLAANRPK